MLTVIGVRFRAAGKIYYFDPADRQIKIGDHVIVETARGIEYGYVVLGNREVDETKVIPPLKPVIRMATDEDRAIEAKNKEKEKAENESMKAESIAKFPACQEHPVTSRVRIGVARDEAFCFYYQENFRLLEQMGAELGYFSPLRDKKIPDRVDGLLFGGVYPENFAGELA